MKKYYCHEDAQHGWLAVKRAELISLGIINEITRLSYQKGKTVYLEEDADTTTFINRKKELGEEVAMKGSYQEYSPIRNYETFTVKGPS